MLDASLEICSKFSYCLLLRTILHNISEIGMFFFSFFLFFFLMYGIESMVNHIQCKLQKKKKSLSVSYKNI